MDKKIVEYKVNFEFDIELLIEETKTLIPKNTYTEGVIDVIKKLAFLYNIEPITMKQLVIGSLTNADGIDVYALRKECREYSECLQLNQAVSLPHISADNNQEEKVEGAKNKQEKLIQYFENISPVQMLRDMGNGAEPSLHDKQVIESVLLQQKLPFAVLNVLLQYVLMKSNMKINKTYMEKIAAHWARKQVSSAKEAMLLAKQENIKYQEWNAAKKVRSVSEPKNMNVIDLPNGKALNLFLSEASHYQLINLTRSFGFQSDDETIGYLLNEAFQQLKKQK